jgi:hypothetical protein
MPLGANLFSVKMGDLRGNQILNRGLYSLIGKAGDGGAGYHASSCHKAICDEQMRP